MNLFSKKPIYDSVFRIFSFEFTFSLSWYLLLVEKSFRLFLFFNLLFMSCFQRLLWSWRLFPYFIVISYFILNSFPMDSTIYVFSNSCLKGFFLWFAFLLYLHLLSPEKNNVSVFLLFQIFMIPCFWDLTLLFFVFFIHYFEFFNHCSFYSLYF